MSTTTKQGFRKSKRPVADPTSNRSCVQTTSRLLSHSVLPYSQQEPEIRRRIRQQLDYWASLPY
jgi:hypothetical protein